MIGLGSNRLTVCRRGGMSVTQAGRGGMEWLGVRAPLWAQWWLPYSRQAGEALKAQFPTQWPTIRDYGFAHPEYIAAINFAAPQDPEIMYSLIPTLGKVRKITGDGTSYLLTNTYIKDTWRFVSDIKLAANAGNFWEGMYVDNESKFLWGRYGGQGRIYFISSRAGDQPNTSVSDSTYYIVDFDGKAKTLKLNSTTYNLNGTTNGRVQPYPFALFSENDGDVYGSYMKGERTFAEFYDENGVLKARWIPCKHDGQNGMLDILSATFTGNNGFTISETPAS